MLPKDLSHKQEAIREPKFNICSHLNIFFRDGFVYFSKTMFNHKLHPLQQQSFIVDESDDAEPVYLQSRPITKTVEQQESSIRPERDNIPSRVHENYLTF